jgi:hypothetical protein
MNGQCAGKYKLSLLCWQKIALGNKGRKKTRERERAPSSSCNSSRRGANKSIHSDCLGTQKTSPTLALPDSLVESCSVYVCMYALWEHYQSWCCVCVDIFIKHRAAQYTISVGRRSFAFVSALISRLVMRPYNSSLPDELTNWLCVLYGLNVGAWDSSCFCLHPRSRI